jgi:hypothetical protein
VERRDGLCCSGLGSPLYLGPFVSPGAVAVQGLGNSFAHAMPFPPESAGKESMGRTLRPRSLLISTQSGPLPAYGSVKLRITIMTTRSEVSSEQA